MTNQPVPHMPCTSTEFDSFLTELALRHNLVPASWPRTVPNLEDARRWRVNTSPDPAEQRMIAAQLVIWAEYASQYNHYLLRAYAAACLEVGAGLVTFQPEMEPT